MSDQSKISTQLQVLCTLSCRLIVNFLFHPQYTDFLGILFGIQFVYAELAAVHNNYVHNTVEPPNKGHFGNGHFVLFSEAVPISRRLAIV